MFLVIGFTIIGGQIVFGGKSSELMVGFMIGVAFMLAELFFVLMVAFFILGAEATHNGYSKLIALLTITSGFYYHLLPPSGSDDADKAYAAFSMFNMIIYLVWGIILTVHRRTVMVTQQEADASKAKEFSAYDGTEGNETYNPTIGAAGGEDFSGDQEEL